MWYYVDLMRALIAALMLTLAIAVTASVFAIWPVVADAPWEEQGTPVADSGELRCNAALDLLNDLLVGGTFENSVNEDRLETVMNIARGAIDDHC